jgi:hypothetical protein
VSPRQGEDQNAWREGPDPAVTPCWAARPTETRTKRYLDAACAFCVGCFFFFGSF